MALWYVCIGLILLFVPSVGWAMHSRGWSGRRAFAAGMAVLLALFLIQRLDANASDERKIERTIEAAATSTNPGICDELLTTQYLEQRWGVREPYADEDCESEVTESRAVSVEISRIDIDGDRATALTRTVGGLSDGSRRRTELVKEDNHWKLNRLAAIVGFDRGRWERAFRAGFIGFGATTAAADCALNEVRRLSDEEVKRLTISDPRGVFTAIFVECDRSGIERALRAAVESPEYDLPASVAACAQRRIRATTDAELVHLQHDLAAFSLLTYKCGPTAYFASLERRLVDSDYLDSTEADCVVDRFEALPPRSGIKLGYDDDRYEELIASCKS